MKRSLSLVLVLSLVCAAASAQEKPARGTPDKPKKSMAKKSKQEARRKDKEKAATAGDPLDILRKVDAAAKALNAVRYDVVVETTGAAEAIAGKTKASITATGAAPAGSGQPLPERFVIEAEITLPEKKETRRITGGSDGEVFYIIHHDEKKAYVDIDPAVLGSAGRELARAMMIEFLHPTPFDDEINGRSRELLGSKMIGDEDCYEIHVVYASEQAPEAVWYFSKRDFLPRCRVDKFTLPDGRKGAIKKTITRLEVEPKLDGDAFVLKLPEGYTKTDEFAP
jgi:hypothetical protein